MERNIHSVSESQFRFVNLFDNIAPLVPLVAVFWYQ